jgi:outer membrane protein OmpA-like peptidoglycan-associated protein
MEVISYGSDQPVSDNSTRDGREQNRRVVILVYE